MPVDQAKWDKLTQRARAFVKLVIAGDTATANEQLNPAMRQAMPGDALKQLWVGLEAQAGPFNPAGKSAVKTNVEENYDCVYLEAQFEKAVLWIKVVFEGDKVAGLQFVPEV